MAERNSGRCADCLTVAAGWRAHAQVYALTKERDALRRNSERLNSATDLVKEKDAIIQQARRLFWCHLPCCWEPCINTCSSLFTPRSSLQQCRDDAHGLFWS